MFGNKMLFYLVPGRLEQLEFKLEKLLGFGNMARKVRKIFLGFSSTIRKIFRENIALKNLNAISYSMYVVEN